MATAYHNLSEYDFNSVPNAENMKFGIVVSEWNFNITGALLNGAVNTLKKHGVKDENILVKTVPGSFELTFGANQMMENCDVDAIIAIGCVIKGDTPHFDYVCMALGERLGDFGAPEVVGCGQRGQICFYLIYIAQTHCLKSHMN